MSSNLILIGVICSMFMVIVHPEEYLSPVLPARKTVNWFNYLGKVYYVDSIFQVSEIVIFNITFTINTIMLDTVAGLK